MREFFTRALVLERRNLGEVDGLIRFFSEDYGKVTARAKSLRKIQSKLSGYLQPLNFVKVLLVKLAGPSDGFAVVDCLSDGKFSSLETNKRFDLLPVVSLVNTMAGELETDRKLWVFLEEIFLRRFDTKETIRTFLKIAGFNPDGADCFFCHQKEIVAFLPSDHIFLCSTHSSKVPADKIVLL